MNNDADRYRHGPIVSDEGDKQEIARLRHELAYARGDHQAFILEQEPNEAGQCETPQKFFITKGAKTLFP